MQRRFYPSWIESFPGEPDPDDFAVLTLGAEVGEGLVARRGFEPGQLLFRFVGLLVWQPTQWSLQLGEGLHLHDPWFSGKIGHSCEPNAICDMHTREFRALRAIAADEVLTMDYASTEEALFREFRCRCGTPSCRGWIRGQPQTNVTTEVITGDLNALVV